MAKRRRKRRARRKVLNLGATPPPIWHGEITLDCPGLGQRTYKIPGPTAAAAIKRVSSPYDHLPRFAKRCRVVGRRIVGGGESRA